MKEPLGDGGLGFIDRTPAPRQVINSEGTSCPSMVKSRATENMAGSHLPRAPVPGLGVGGGWRTTVPSDLQEAKPEGGSPKPPTELGVVGRQAD